MTHPRTPRLVYLLGIPGAGKTTAMRAALAPWTRVVRSRPFAHELLTDEHGGVVGAHLGTDRDPFGGTDTLPMNVQPRVVEWLRTRPHPVIVGEGDRLGNGSFFAQAEELCRVTVVLLECDPGQAAARRQARSPKQQDPAWVAGRETKVGNLAGRADVVLDAHSSPVHLAHRLHHIIAEGIAQ